MEHLLVANNIGSILLVVVCWWLAHQNATGREPLARTVAGGYAVLALLALGNMLFRNVEEFRPFLPWSLVASKYILVATLGLVARRLGILYR